MTAPSTSVGRLVREGRQRASLTQEQLAVAAGITAKTLRGVEAGSVKAQGRTLRGIARALGMKESDLVVHDSEVATVAGGRG